MWINIMQAHERRLRPGFSIPASGLLKMQFFLAFYFTPLNQHQVHTRPYIRKKFNMYRIWMYWKWK
uniref:Uncharacterized protein n=1 Tax=Anguilla anguilla TaxID=7936 RepID=A0A0E9RMY7_ANGAN